MYGTVRTVVWELGGSDPPGYPIGGEAEGSSSSDGTTGPAQPPPPPPSCDTLYSSVDDYQLCNEEPTQCRFAVTLGGSTCGQLCSGLGQTCLGAQANDEGDDACEDLGQGHDCNTSAGTEICICSRM